MTTSLARAAVSAVVAVAAAVWLAVGLEGRAPTARERFETARAAEADARTAARKGTDDEPLLRQARRVLQRYEAVVRRFPTSGYSDDALFFAGSLAQWIHERSGLDADRRSAARYFDWLLREYPASRHLRDARTAVRALLEPGPRAAPPVPAPPVPAPPAAARPAPAAAVPAGGPPVLQSISRAILDDTVRVTLALDREAAFTHEILAGPPRAFVDLVGALPIDSLRETTVRYDADAVRMVRVGRRPGATRVVLDLTDATRVSVFALYNPFRIVIDAERAPRLPAAAVPAEAPVILTGEVSPSLASPAPDVPAAPPAPPPAPIAPTVVPAAPAGPSANADGSYSLARQLGLGISRIVIDPGHGGHDPGTLAHGTSEARLVLDVALRLEKLLERERFDVVLTRRTDVFVPLEERTAIANRETADLFLSIHANASRDPNARGLETYYLSFASNPDAESVAARENATSSGGMHNLTSIVRAIALNNKLDESRDLAGMVQRSLAARLGRGPDGSRSRGVKKAPFVVLIGAAMPSVLAEIGFITNRTEAGLIKTPAYRQRVAEALHAAVLQYQRSLKRQTTVADTGR